MVPSISGLGGSCSLAFLFQLDRTRKCSVQEIEYRRLVRHCLAGFGCKKQPAGFWATVPDFFNLPVVETLTVDKKNHDP
jgi:hypothetical protein